MNERRAPFEGVHEKLNELKVAVAGGIALHETLKGLRYDGPLPVCLCELCRGDERGLDCLCPECPGRDGCERFTKKMPCMIRNRRYRARK
jgi:hypothetical protein